jgi:NAD(P)-dependent dehydrogenase (short-subunit alcohol dehydrogenase family)
VSTPTPAKTGLALFDLTGRVAVVTGGSRGLGLTMATGLASAGADVVLVSRNEGEVTAAAAGLASSTGRKAIGVKADVTNPADAERIAARALEAFGRIDVLINNAGVNVRGPIDGLTLEQFRQVQQVNVEGVWLACKAVVPHMKQRRHGRVINVSSALGVVGLADRTPYCTSKGAVVQLTRALSVELAPFNVTVNAILPGPFLTEMNMELVRRNDPQFHEQIIGATAFKRLGELHEIQGAALFLASDASSYVTGAMLPVDGGWTAH